MPKPPQPPLKLATTHLSEAPWT